MKDIDAWLLFDGPEPEHLRPLLDALYGLTPGASEEEEEREGGQSSEGLTAGLAQGEDPSVATAAPIAPIAPIAPAPGDRRVGEYGVTVRSPSFAERPAAPPPVEPPCVQVAAREPRPPEVRSPVEDLRITSVALDVPAEFRKQMASLPFKPRAPGTELARTMQVPVLNLWQGQRAPARSSTRSNTVEPVASIGHTRGVSPLGRVSVL